MKVVLIWHGMSYVAKPGTFGLINTLNVAKPRRCIIRNSNITSNQAYW